MPVICIANSKSSGKTTVTLNLIPHLKPDMIIDLDVHEGLTDINSLGGGLVIHKTRDKDELLDWMDDEDKLILVDTGGFDSTLNRMALSQSDFIITPTSDDPHDQLRLKKFHQTMVEVSNMVDEKLVANVLLNRVHHSRRSFPDFDELISKMDHFERLKHVIPQSAALTNAAFFGQPVQSGSVAAVFNNLAKHIKKCI